LAKGKEKIPAATVGAIPLPTATVDPRQERDRTITPLNLESTAPRLFGRRENGLKRACHNQPPFAVEIARVAEFHGRMATEIKCVASMPVARAPILVSFRNVGKLRILKVCRELPGNADAPLNTPGVMLLPMIAPTDAARSFLATG
jgi:hypothetical protein